jgi:hypothetical protein
MIFLPYYVLVALLLIAFQEGYAYKANETVRDVDERTPWWAHVVFFFVGFVWPFFLLSWCCEVTWKYLESLEKFMKNKISYSRRSSDEDQNS